MTKIFILCGGKGTRMHQAELGPKALIDIGNGPILFHQLRHYAENGFKQYVFCIGYKGEEIRKYVQAEGFEGEFSDSGEAAGMLLRLYEARSLMSEPIVICYGDTYAQIDVQALLDQHEQSGLMATMVTASIEHPFGLVERDHQGRVESFREKPILNHYIGFAVFSPRIFEIIPEEIIHMDDGDGLVKAFEILAQRKELGSYVFEGLQVTINKPEDIGNAQARIGSYYTANE